MQRLLDLSRNYPLWRAECPPHKKYGRGLLGDRYKSGAGLSKLYVVGRYDLQNPPIHPNITLWKILLLLLTNSLNLGS